MPASIREQVLQMRIEVESPDGTAWVTSTPQTGIEVDFDPDIHDVHTDRTLAEQLEIALADAILEFEDQAADIIGGSPPDPDSQAAKRRAKMAEEVEELDLSGRTACGTVAIDWIGKNGFIVNLNYTPTQCSPSRLRRLINQTLADINQRRGLETMKIHRNCYRYDRLSEKVGE